MTRRRFLGRAAVLAAGGGPVRAREHVPNVPPAAGEASEASGAAVGPVLVGGVVQPFDLRYEVAAIHAMLVLDGHPEVESVEAMIGPPRDGRRDVRVVVTAHDQTQVDHVSDRRVLDDVAGLDRRVVSAPVRVEVRDEAIRPVVELAFRAWHGGSVAMRVEALGPPEAARGGLTDPGTHAARSSLPVMVRERSTLAGPGSALSLDGRDVRLARLGDPCGGFTPPKGFVTLGHHLLVLRAGERPFQVAAVPPCRAPRAPARPGGSTTGAASVPTSSSASTPAGPSSPPAPASGPSAWR